MNITHILKANGPLFTVLFVSLSLASLTVVLWRWWLNMNARTDLVDFLARLDDVEDELLPTAPPSRVQVQPAYEWLLTPPIS